MSELFGLSFLFTMNDKKVSKKRKTQVQEEVIAEGNAPSEADQLIKEIFGDDTPLKKKREEVSDAYLCSKESNDQTDGMCPFHFVELTCINPDTEEGTYFFRCDANVSCPVFVTDETADHVLSALKMKLHSSIKNAIIRSELECFCEKPLRPYMKLCRKEGKNQGKIFFCCPTKKEDGGCKFFQWFDIPLKSKQEGPKVTLRQFKQANKRAETPSSGLAPYIINKYLEDAKNAPTEMARKQILNTLDFHKKNPHYGNVILF